MDEINALRKNAGLTNEAYRPGVTTLTRSMHIPTDEQWMAVKAIRWPYGIDVKYDDKSHDITFRTAKMKTVANILEKTIDFDATSAADVLDLPIELRY